LGLGGITIFDAAIALCIQRGMIRAMAAGGDVAKAYRAGVFTEIALAGNIALFGFLFVFPPAHSGPIWSHSLSP